MTRNPSAPPDGPKRPLPAAVNPPFPALGLNPGTHRPKPAASSASKRDFSQPDELVDHQALMQGTETWRVVANGKPTHVSVHGRFKADNGEALLAAALAGLGIAGLPDFLIDRHIATGALVQVLVDLPPPEGGIYIVRPPGDFPPRKVRALIEIVIERFTAPAPSSGSGVATRQLRHENLSHEL